MRINDRIIENATIDRVSDRVVQGRSGLKRVTLYEARVEKNGKTQKKRAESLSVLQNWVFQKLGPKVS